jgi:hypothetical protein
MSTDLLQHLLENVSISSSMLSTTLLDLPVEVWHALSHRLFFWHVMRLYACGSRRLIDIMTNRGGVTDAVMIFSGSDVQMSWVPQISEFRNLRTFIYDCGAVIAGEEFYPTKKDMKSLPRSLRYFKLRADAAEEAFLTDFDGEDRAASHSYSVGDLLNISSIWPELVSFNICQYGSNKHLDLPTDVILSPLLKTLPTTVEIVTLRGRDPLKLEVVEALPSDVVKLYLYHETNNLSTASFQKLPPHLDTLVCVSYNRMKPGVDLSPWGTLPQTLSFLCILLGEASPDLINLLPPNLTYLNLGFGIVPDCYSAVSSRLIHLQGLVIHDSLPHKWHDLSNPDHRSDTIQLRYIPRITNSMHHKVDSFFTFVNQSERWVRVPQESRFRLDQVY